MCFVLRSIGTRWSAKPRPDRMARARGSAPVGSSSPSLSAMASSLSSSGPASSMMDVWRASSRSTSFFTWLTTASTPESSLGGASSLSQYTSTWSGSGTSLFATAASTDDFPDPFSPTIPYLHPWCISMSVSTTSGFPPRLTPKLSNLTSMSVFLDASTPVTDRFAVAAAWCANTPPGSEDDGPSSPRSPLRSIFLMDRAAFFSSRFAANCALRASFSAFSSAIFLIKSESSRRAMASDILLTYSRGYDT
mmetsp:Transcript_11420/g.28945  ORF Transcript_11420/g.28945 Transcript_11420/m.28945 type:complete len:250 (-) Transcript_11420:112-861(-)